jgi:hypothetical protein
MLWRSGADLSSQRPPFDFRPVLLFDIASITGTVQELRFTARSSGTHKYTAGAYCRGVGLNEVVHLVATSPQRCWSKRGGAFSYH